jgi:hypothetical protein
MYSVLFAFSEELLPSSNSVTLIKPPVITGLLRTMAAISGCETSARFRPTVDLSPLYTSGLIIVLFI